MIDMSKFIAARSDQLNADDLIDAPRTVTVTKVTAAPDAAEQPVSIHFEGDQGKPFKPCKTMRRILVGVWGKDASKYVGRSMTLYRDPTVAFGGLQVGGIRISHMSDIGEDKTVALLVTRGRKAPFKIKPLKDAPARSQSVDHGAALAELKAIAKPGNMDALGAKWQDIGAEARKALAAELPALKAACDAEPKPSDDVPFGDEQPADVNDAGPRTLGDQLADTPAEAKAAEIRAALNSANDAAAVETIIADAEAHRDAFDEATLTGLEVAYSQARARFSVAA